MFYNQPFAGLESSALLLQLFFLNNNLVTMLHFLIDNDNRHDLKKRKRLTILQLTTTIHTVLC